MVSLEQTLEPLKQFLMLDDADLAHLRHKADLYALQFSDQAHSRLALEERHGLSGGSIALLMDKGFSIQETDKKGKKETRFSDLLAVLDYPDITFEDRRKAQTPLEERIEQGASMEITMGRYRKFVKEFEPISSEYAVVKGRMRFQVEYIIALADELKGQRMLSKEFVPRAFTDEEKTALRSIYENFRIKDYLAVQVIEDKTKHDVVAANTWLTIRAQQLGIDDKLMRKIVHFARTSADIDTNVRGHLYMRAIGEWTKSLAKLVGTLAKKGEEYRNMACIAETHGQAAQLTTLGHIYANLAAQIRQHAEPLLQPEPLRIDGKIAGAIGTDADMRGALPDFKPREMYLKLVEGFGLRFTEHGNDQDCSNASLDRILDTMVNVGMVVQKAACDTWIYAQRDILSKKVESGESGSSAMPQKKNPFLAEGAEALMEIVANMVTPIKKMITAYREQGDLRRSITSREGYHPIMLSIIAMERLVTELNGYQANPLGMELAINDKGASVISSIVSNYLKTRGMDDAYDAIKRVVTEPYVTPERIMNSIAILKEEGRIDAKAQDVVTGMLHSVMDSEGLRSWLERAPENTRGDVINIIAKANQDVKKRERLIGSALEQTDSNIGYAKDTTRLLKRYTA
jgi:adenylosuccinate lyase